MPSTDFGSGTKSPGGYGGASTGGAGGPSGPNAGGKGGITTGNTIYGNTAFGRPGGMATGYAMFRPAANGPTPLTGTYSDFRTLSGAPMFGGGLQGMGVNAGNASRAHAFLQAMAARRPQPAGGGLLDADLPPDRPAVPEIPPPMPVDNGYGYYFMKNPTQRPYDVRNSPPLAYLNGTYPSGKGNFGESSAAMPPGKGDFNGGKGNFGGSNGY